MKYVLLCLLLANNYCFAEKLSKELLAKSKEVEVAVNDILASTDTKKVTTKYIGYELVSSLDAIFGSRKKWTENKSLIFKCSDGYRAEIPVKIILDNKAYLVFEKKGEKEFKLENHTQGGKNVDLAPYYVVWANIEMQKVNLARYWPYQVVEILLVP